MKLQISLTTIVLTFCLLVFTSLLLAQQPTTNPSDKQIPDLPADMVIRLPDGREVNLADLQKEGGAAFAMVRNDGAGTTVNAVDEEGRKITITDNADGIVVSIKETDKEPAEYRAENIDQLRQDHPEIAEMYDKYYPKDLNIAGVAGGGGAGVMDQRVMIRMGSGGIGGHGIGPNFPSEIESLGAHCLPGTDPFVKAQLGEGVRITSVSDDGLAHKLGLQKHDFITAVNGKPVKSDEELEEAITGAGGAKVTMEVLRAGKSVKLEEQ